MFAPGDNTQGRHEPKSFTGQKASIILTPAKTISMKKALSVRTFVLAAICGCTLFPIEERLIAEHTRVNGDKIMIYFVSTGATTENVLQIRKKGLNSKHEILKSLTKYNYLENSKLVNDSTLSLILKDTTYFKRIDTIMLKIN